MKILLFMLVSLGGLSTALAQGHGNPGGGNSAPKCESQNPDKLVDMACIEEQLKTTGLGGWVHASVKDQLMLVFTWRRPGNFFENIQLPMASKDKTIMQELLKLRRHDQISIKGEFFKNEAPIEHINVTELKMIKEYDGPEDQFNYDPKLPDSILYSTKLIGKVHIVANGGSVLVVESGDRVIPVFNEKPELVKGLFRNDKIEINYNVQFLPQRPPHLMLDTAMASPVKVMERIEEGHGTDIELTGPLVMFSKSPQIKFNVFALRTEDKDGVNRNYTIVNFSDFDLFFQIRDKLQQTWDNNLKGVEYDRNKYINRDIILTVKGKKNVVSPDQANPQIVPDEMTDVEISIQ